MALFDRNLIPGSIYFIVMYEDEDLHIPVIQTLIFVETVVKDDGDVTHFFRDISAPAERQRFHVHEHQVDQLLLDWDGLLSTLNDCHNRLSQKKRE